MHLHDQRWLFLRRRAEVGVQWRIVERMRRSAAGGGEFDGFGHRDEGRIQLDRSRCAQYAMLAGVQVDRHQCRFRGGCGGHRECGARRQELNVRKGNERQVQWGEFSRPQVHYAELVARAYGIAYDCASVSCESIVSLSQGPERPCGLRLEYRARRDPIVLIAIEIPPVGAVGYEVERAVRIPAGLYDRFLEPTGNGRAMGEFRTREIRHIKCGGVPRHVRMVPRDPRNASAVGAHTGIGHEVALVEEHGTWAAGGGVESDYRVFRLAAAGVILPDAEKALSASFDLVVGVAEALGCERHGCLSMAVRVDALVCKIAKIHQAAADGVRCASILMNARARVESRRRQVFRATVRGAGYHDVTAALSRSTFYPIRISVRDLYIVECDRGSGQISRRKRGVPCAVR